ncbi:hypothetical protein NB524_06410 [Vibrio alginolyticus]|uniref:hypothetical protein n=1 Tax=Vibrio alginolyticus TaxID=663 RepID=UPI00215D44B6|nr:hypothetical protein [Vibrio alginolyticus]MCR9569979.1 hypothetical protein [Vibrio alginolyticus]
MTKLITSLHLGEDQIRIFEGRTLTYEKCAVVCFQGKDGWGVTMNIFPEHVDTFLNTPSMQISFLAFAKQKLGVSA